MREPGALTGRVIDTAMCCLCGIGAALVSSTRVRNVADAAHDAGVVRVIGLVPTPWRALDVVFGSLFWFARSGNAIFRAELGGVLAIAISAAALFDITRRLLVRFARAPRLAPLTAAISTLSAVLGPAWQQEGATVGGSSTGACLILLTLALTLGALDRPTRARSFAIAMLLGLSAGQEPLVGATAFLAAAVVATSCASHRAIASAQIFGEQRAVGTFGLLGLGPFIIALARTRASGAPLVQALADDWAGERGAAVAQSLWIVAQRNVGVVGAGLAVAGLGMAALGPSVRPIAFALVAVVAMGIVFAWAGAPAGPTRVAAPALAATAAAWALASLGLYMFVSLVAQARIAFARSAAAMVFLLELVIPVEIADAALRPTPLVTDAWDSLVWGMLPPNAVLILGDRRLYLRALAAQVSKSLSDRVTLVPFFAGANPSGPSHIDETPWRYLERDLALEGKPSEALLVELSDKSPIEMAFDPAWGRAIARHLVPDGLFDRYSPEPRGATDRWRALENFRVMRQKLEALVANDPDLVAVTDTCLRARAASSSADVRR